MKGRINIFNFCWHCWHTIPGSRRKLEAFRFKKCNLKKDDWGKYINDGGYVNYILLDKCCKCQKIKESPIYRDYQPERAMKYPNYSKINK